MRARALTASAVAIAVIGAAVAALRRLDVLDVVEVRGRSMAPGLRPGDRLLVVRTSAIGRGDVVLAADPRDPGRELIKRVASIESGRVTLRGDNPVASTDARTFGSVAASAIRWRAVLRYWPLDRAGSLPPAPAASAVAADEGGETACTFPQALIAGE